MEIPGYKEACEREARVRQDACLPGALTRICGVPVRQMTLDDLVLLDAAGNPFVCGGVATAPHIAQFLWIISPQFGAFRSLDGRPFPRIRAWREARAKARFTRSIRLIDSTEAIAGIQSYMDEMFLDTPPSRSGHDNEPPIVSFSASIVSVLATRFGWTHAEVRSLPIPLIYQYIRLITDRDRAEAGIHAPAFSKFRDRAKSAALRALKNK